MKLLELQTGMVSLEFAPTEREALMAALKKHGPVKRLSMATFDRISVGGEHFISENEWDEPCLISTTPKGADLLRRLVSSHTRSRAA